MPSHRPPLTGIISILAPTRGATKNYVYKKLRKRFQSSLPRGERRKAGNPISATGKFQSSLPRGERLRRLLTAFRYEDFNPRSHEGSDATSQTHRQRQTKFQSSLPRGERRTFNFGNTEQARFQSSLPRGERQQFSPKSSLFSQQKLSKIFNLNNKLF